MDLRSHEPSKPLNYLALIKTLVWEFREVTSHRDLIGRLGEAHVVDITNVPEIKLIETEQALSPEFKERVYQFRDCNLGRGVFDAVFYNAEMVSMRAQVFFEGRGAKSKARKYLSEVLIPQFQLFLGQSCDQSPDLCIFRSKGLIGVTHFMPGTPSISSALTDERFA